MEVIGYSQMFGYPHSSKYLLCSEIHTGLEQYEGILDKLFLQGYLEKYYINYLYFVIIRSIRKGTVNEQNIIWSHYRDIWLAAC